MKNIFKSLVFIALIAIYTSSFAQNFAEKKRVYRGTLKLYPANLIASEFLLGAEGAISRKHSFNLNLGTTLSEKSQIYNGNDLLGFRGELQFRTYLTGDNILNGFYVGPYFNARNLNIDKTYHDYYIDQWGGVTYTNDIVYRVKAKSYAGGLIMGYQGIISDAFVVDFYLGSGLKYSTDNEPLEYKILDNGYYYYYDQNTPGVFSFRSTGINVNAGFSIGVTL